MAATNFVAIFNTVRAIPRFEIDLNGRPAITQAGVSIHGSRVSEVACLHGLWSLLAYHYSGELVVAGTTYPFHAGSVCIFPPEVAVEWRFPPHATHHYVHFSPPTTDGPRIQLPLLQELDSDFDPFCLALDEMILYQPHDPLRAAVRLWDLLHRLRRDATNSSYDLPAHTTVQKALAIIRNEHTDSIKVGAIAKVIGVSNNHLTKVFKQYCGCGLKQYLLRERVKRACHLLQRSPLSIKAISIDVGSPSAQHFNKMIRKATGLSPKEYRVSSRQQDGSATLKGRIRLL